MKSLHNSAIHLAFAGWAVAFVLSLPSAAQAGCIITIAPGDTETNLEKLDKIGVPELAGGPEELFGCSRTPYLRSTSTVQYKLVTPRTERAPVGSYRTHANAGSSTRDRDITRSFGFRYPGFTRTYDNHRYTVPVRVYRGGVFTGSTKIYSGPRFTNTTSTVRPRYTGFQRTYRGQRYTGFSRSYRGPRYPGDVTATRRTRW